MLIDSNIIIYSALPEYAFLRQLIAEHAPVVSAVSYVEVLGFHSLSEEARLHFEAFFAASTVLPLSQSVLDQAVILRQSRRMTLGDSLVAATCLVNARTLVTRNVLDFGWISGLNVINPFEEFEGGAATVSS